MRPLASCRRGLAAALVISLAACSTETTAPDSGAPDADVARAAATMAQVGDSLRAAGADPMVVAAYDALASTVSALGRVSDVMIDVDGVPTSFLATAREVREPQPLMLCVAAPCSVEPARALIAWQKDNPRRVVQLVPYTSLFTLAADSLSAAPSSLGATLVYLDGAGGFYSGRSGTQSLTATTSTEPCPSHTNGLSLPVHSPLWQDCLLATFTAAFDGTVAPPPYGVRANTATGTHALRMASQAVLGVSVVAIPIPCAACMGDSVAYPIVPIAAPRYGRPVLAPALTAYVDSIGHVVTFTFTVTNRDTVAHVLHFNSSQEYDFVVSSLTAGAPLWTWSANRAFAQLVGSRTLAVGESRVYQEQWTPTAQGLLFATAKLTSSSDPLVVSTTFTVP
ncbi:MAG: hypothetical protein JWN53_928 [Gemmatimonadetes bacterium]|nr:hypothetical protein [Gemmatimonadota bacterium]